MFIGLLSGTGVENKYQVEGFPGAAWSQDQTRRVADEGKTHLQV
jgi:hypothetical protein